MGVYSSNRTWLSENKNSSDDSNILELMIDSRKTDMEIFETVIDNDFSHAYCEAGLIYLSEADSDQKDKDTGTGIIAKIKSIINRIKEAVKNFFGKFKKKVKEVIDNDKELWDKYGEVVKKNGVGKTITTKYKESTIKVDITKEVASFDPDDAVEKVTDAFSDSTKKISSGNSWEDVKPQLDEAIKNFNKKIDDESAKYDEEIAPDKEDHDITFDGEMVNNICNSIRIGLAKANDLISSYEKYMNSEIDSIFKAASYLQRVEDSDNDEKIIAAYNGLSSYSTTLSSSISKITSLLSKVVEKTYAAHRDAFSKLGAVCSESNKKDNSKEENKSSEEKKEEAKEESARIAAIGMLSDIYMEQAFAF